MITFEESIITAIFCGITGVFLKPNLLNIQVSLLQIIGGINALFFYHTSPFKHNYFHIFLLLFLTLNLILFFCALAVLLIRKRSTLQVNEFTEFRG
jgi:NADH:ubiquinone oxidoreductase subunit K